MKDIREEKEGWVTYRNLLTLGPCPYLIGQWQNRILTMTSSANIRSQISYIVLRAFQPLYNLKFLSIKFYCLVCACGCFGRMCLALSSRCWYWWILIAFSFFTPQIIFTVRRLLLNKSPHSQKLVTWNFLEEFVLRSIVQNGFWRRRRTHWPTTTLHPICFSDISKSILRLLHFSSLVDLFSCSGHWTY